MESKLKIIYTWSWWITKNVKITSIQKISFFFPLNFSHNVKNQKENGFHLKISFLLMKLQILEATQTHLIENLLDQTHIIKDVIYNFFISFIFLKE